MNNTADTKKETADNIILTNIDYAYVVASVILFLPTVTGNSIILISLYRFRKLRSLMGILIGNLAVSDLLVGVILLPMALAARFLDVFKHKYPCLISLGISVSLTSSSVLNMLAISVERYISVAYPFQHRSSRIKTVVKTSIPFIWSTAILLGSLPVMGLHKEQYNNVCTYNEVFIRGYTICVTSFYAVGIFGNVGCFVSVVRVALTKLNAVRNSDTSQNHMRVSKNLTKTYVMMLVSAAFIICWGPFSTLTIIGLFYRWSSYPLAVRWSYFFGFLNSGINWMIYGFKTPKFKRAMKAVVTCKEMSVESYISDSSVAKSEQVGEVQIKF